MDTPEVANAQPEVQTPQPISAVDHAVMEGDQNKFREAKQAERIGKPLPEVAPKAEEPAKAIVDETKPPAAPAPTERTLSATQQRQNERTQRAVEQATADLQAELARLRSQLPKEPAAPAPTKEAEYKRYAAMPDAPKLNAVDAQGNAVFETIDEHAAAMALFITDKRLSEHTATQKAEAQRAQRYQAAQQKLSDYGQRCEEFLKTDPDFHKRLSDDVKDLQPFDALREGERGTASHAIAEEILRSPYGPQLALHLSDHPEELDRLHTLSPYELNLEFGMLRWQFKQTSQPHVAAPPQPKTVSSAPPPPTVLGSKATEPADPETAAVAAGDFDAFRANRRAKLAASMR